MIAYVLKNNLLEWIEMCKTPKKQNLNPKKIQITALYQKQHNKTSLPKNRQRQNRKYNRNSNQAERLADFKHLTETLDLKKIAAAATASNAI